SPLPVAEAESFSPPAATFSADRTVIPLVPTDVTNLRLFNQPLMGPVNMPKLDPGACIKRLKEDSFPDVSQARESSDGIIVKPKSGCDFERPAPADVQLMSGTIFVSVRKPANMVFVTTPHGVVSINQDAEVIVSYRDGLLIVMNLSAFNERVKVRIHQAAVSAQINGKSYSEASSEGIVIAVKYGHELVAGDRALTAGDLRPADSVARRRTALFENDHMAVSEFSLATALTDSELLSDLGKPDGDPRERKILKDLAKMAAVLNYVNGQGGYVARGKSN
ncbi:MAG: hypothetical protein JST01_12815, partial [Cyanobacteria bacterium SZAS TMP-1]|nr:hypothetical protein [Cyanobacteria bacterium SZAS TMP-1]